MAFPCWPSPPCPSSPGTSDEGSGQPSCRSPCDGRSAWPETTVVVLGDPAYYGRFGFRPARELGITGPFGDIDEFQALRLAAASPSGRLTYAAPFGIA